MESSAEYVQIIANRENLYRFLGRLYREEADQPLLEQMKLMQFPVDSDEEELAAGYRQLEAYLRHPGMDPLTDLAVDFARAFLGAGIADEKDVAYPYESVYTSPQRMIMQDARDQVLAIYRAKGLDKSSALNVPEDHIALELEFMARLCGETQRSPAAQDWPALSTSLKEQQDFLAQHLLNWVPSFCADLQSCAETPFYKAVATITRAYLRMEQAILEDLISETAAPVAQEASFPS